MKNVAVFVSGGGTNFQALLDNNLGEYIKLVVSSNKNAYALERAKNYDIPSIVTNDEDDIMKALAKNKIDYIVLAGYLKILKGKILTQYKDRIVNVHPSLIPAFCGDGMYGLKVHEAALKSGVKITGATVHLVNEIVDGGEILAQKAVEIMKGDTPVVLQKRVMTEAEQIILPQVVKELLNV